MLPDDVLPLAACTVSFRPSIVSVSCASSIEFLIEYVHEYG